MNILCFFEDWVNEIFGEGESKFVIDCCEFEYVLSVGLCVFLMLVWKFQGKGGVLVFCFFSDFVCEVLDIFGFLCIFIIEGLQVEVFKKINVGVCLIVEVDFFVGDFEVLSLVVSFVVLIFEGKLLFEILVVLVLEVELVLELIFLLVQDVLFEILVEFVGFVFGGVGEGGQSKGGFWSCLCGKF